MEITGDEFRMIEAYRAKVALENAGVPSTSAIVAMKLWVKHVLEGLRLEIEPLDTASAEGIRIEVLAIIDRRLQALDQVDGKPG